MARSTKPPSAVRVKLAVHMRRCGSTWRAVGLEVGCSPETVRQWFNQLTPGSGRFARPLRATVLRLASGSHAIARRVSQAAPTSRGKAGRDVARSTMVRLHDRHLRHAKTCGDFGRQFESAKVTPAGGDLATTLRPHRLGDPIHVQICAHASLLREIPECQILVADHESDFTLMRLAAHSSAETSQRTEPVGIADVGGV